MEGHHQRSMRILTIATAAALAMATVATATASDVQYECTTNGAGNWKIVASGPVSTQCPNLPVRACTEIQYAISPQLGRAADHVAVLVDHAMSVIPPQASYLSSPCDGDSVTGIGIRDCSTQAVRMNKDATTQTYNLFVEGAASATGKSIVIKKGTVIEECSIVSLAPSTCDPKSQQAAKETFQFEDCLVEIEIDPCTGEPGDATVLSGDCAIDSGPIESLQLVINGTTQNVTVGKGWISSGENSCTTTLYLGRKYTTCTCKDASDCTVKNSNGQFICGTPCPRL